MGKNVNGVTCRKHLQPISCEICKWVKNKFCLSLTLQKFDNRNLSGFDSKKSMTF